MKADNIMLATILDLIKSVFGFFRYIKVGRKIDEQQIEINDLQLKRLREEDIAKQRADIFLILSNDGGVSNLTITNQGCAIAKNLRIIGLDSLYTNNWYISRHCSDNPEYFKLFIFKEDCCIFIQS
jgi:hypothetical protein